MARLVTRVTTVGAGYVDLERPLPFNVSLAWAPRIHKYEPAPGGRECGIEELTLRFEWSPYNGHLKVCASSEGCRWG